MKRLFSTLVIFAATAALVAACAGGDADEDTTAGNEQEAPAGLSVTQVAEPATEDDAEERQATPTATAEATPSDEDGAETAATSADEEYVLSLLEQSSEAQSSVETFQARMTGEIDMGRMTMSLKAEYAFRQPAEMSMKMDAGLMLMEMVMTEGRFFMRIGDGDWEEAPSQDILPFDIESLTSGVYGAELEPGLYQNLSVQEGEVVDGVETVHISFDIDLEKAMDQASAILGEDFSEQLGEAGEMMELSGTVPMEIWLGAEDKLQRKVAFHMMGEVLGQEYEMDLIMELFDYGEPVDIPSLAEMLEETGG